MGRAACRDEQNLGSRQIVAMQLPGKFESYQPAQAVPEECKWFVKERLHGVREFINQGGKIIDSRLLISRASSRIMSNHPLHVSREFLDPLAEGRRTATGIWEENQARLCSWIGLRTDEPGSRVIFR